MESGRFRGAVTLAGTRRTLELDLLRWVTSVGWYVVRLYVVRLSVQTPNQDI
jgi:hypothetical protein